LEENGDFMFNVKCESLVTLGALAGVAAAGFFCGGLVFYLSGRVGKPDSLGPTVVIGTQGPTITALQGLEELATVRIRIADVLTANDGRYSGAWLVKGDALVSVDLSRARFDESTIDADQKHAVLLLPPPRVIQARLDHERTKTWDVKRVTWVPYSGNPDRLRDTAMFEAQKLVEFAAGHADCIDQGKARVEALVAAVYSKLGWTVVVQWSPGARAPDAATDHTGQ
jgi:hypothetical protein